MNQEQAFLKDFDYIFPAARRVRMLDARGAKQHIRKFIAGAPEVMVKVSSYSKTKTALKMHVDYITRQATLEVFDNVGHEFREIQHALGEGSKEDALVDRINAITAANTNSHKDRRLSANIVLSMPPGVHEDGFRAGVRHFLADQYDGHDFFYVFHDDQDHYHAHVVVATEGFDGSRLTTNKDDLQLWRERFAMHLENEGIAADATPAFSRGDKSRNVPRWMSETIGRGTNRRNEESPSYDSEKESSAIGERAKAWGRIADYLSVDKDQEFNGRLTEWVSASFSDQALNRLEDDREGR